MTERICQYKWDGYRIQMHVNNKNGYPKVAAYTRRLNEVTGSLPELREFDYPHEKFILDAEVLVGDSYKETSERVGAENFERPPEANFHIFDIIVDRGSDVSREEYHKRYGRAARVVNLINDERVKLAENFTNITNAKKKADEKGYEGIIVKDLFSEYKFNKRSSAWVKSKNTHETVDVVVSGFVEGEGRNDGRLGKLLIETAGGVSVGGVGTGFTDQQRNDIWENKEEWRGSIIEVTAEAYADNGLRFPAFERRRDDDGEADTVERLNNILPDDA